MSLLDRCITYGVPDLFAAYMSIYRIVQTPDYVVIVMEKIHDARVIPLDDRPHVSSTIRSYMGDARGRWEGETLVVETTNFKARSAYRNADPATLRLVERFTRTAATSVEWAVTVDDPSTWTRQWTFSIPLTMNDREPVLEYACHEGNHAVHNILSAARSAEKKP